MPLADKHIVYDAPVGRILIRYRDYPFALTGVSLLGNGSAGVPKDDGLVPPGGRRVLEWFDAYFEKRPLPTPWAFLRTENFTPLQVAVWEAASEIGFGALSTYGEIARAIGRPGAARFVGNALGKNPFAILVPCHRIVRGDGGLGGFASGIAMKKKLIAFEAPPDNAMLAHPQQMW